jgi:TRAP transporter 4TM/12TM fusion protein
MLALAWDLLVAAAALVPLGWRLSSLDYLASGRFEFVTPATPLELVLGVAFVLAILELCRRLTGWALVAIVAVCLVFPNIAGLPGPFAHKGYTLSQQVDAQFLTLAGTFSIPLQASAEYIALFIVFGAFLERSGLGRFMMDFAIGLVGGTRGGPAKVAVVSSALTGTISGSAPANVLTAGVVTIPLMKRLGYPAYMAGAIEAAASTGGVIMPPVMGSVAFIMAQYVGVPYSHVALYALIPALLYFFGVFLTVHWSALRHGIKGVPREEMPDWKASLMARGHLALPILLLIGLMTLDYSPGYAAAWATLAVILVSWLRKGTRMGPSDIVAALEAGARGALLVAISTAAAGMIVGVFELTGVGLKFAQMATAVVHTLLVGLIIITMIVSIVLGMGVPPSISYIVQVAVTIPMLLTFLKATGMDPKTALIVTHFFVLYFSALAVLTPPDALAAVAAAGIAGSPFLKTALHGTRVAFVAFIVPFMFVYRPALLMLGSWGEIIYALAFAMLGIVALSVALEGHFLRRMTWPERILATAAGILLVFPQNWADWAGLMLLGLLVLVQWQPWASLERHSGR